MKTILVPTDFSDNAANALNYAAGLAGHSQGRIILFHNSDIPLTYSGGNFFSAGDLALGTDPLLPGAAVTNPELEHIYQEKLEQLAEQFRQQTGGRIPLQTQYQWGSLTDNLNDIVRQEKVDLLVMGTKGASSFLDRMIGTTTVSVCKEVHQAVLAVPAQARFKIPEKITFAADLENDEQVYLSQLLQFARPFGSAIALVHVTSSSRQEADHEARLLAHIRQQFPGQAFTLVTLQESNAARGLEAFVQSQQADLIAVGIHERTFLDSLFHSSVTEDLAYHATVPLLTLPEKPYFLEQGTAASG